MAARWIPWRRELWVRMDNEVAAAAAAVAADDVRHYNTRLVIGVGKGTRQLQRVIQKKKTYVSFAVFGIATDSLDVAGSITELSESFTLCNKAEGEEGEVTEISTMVERNRFASLYDPYRGMLGRKKGGAEESSTASASFNSPASPSEEQESEEGKDGGDRRALTAGALDTLAVKLHDVSLSFVGDTMQIPPMYSALRKDGKRLYNMAREGVTVEREPRPIHISALSSAVMLPDALKPPGYNRELPDWCSSIDMTRVIGVGFALKMTCSSGTYVRTVVDDVARRLGSMATVTHLERVEVSPFTRADCISFEDCKDQHKVVAAIEETASRYDQRSSDADPSG